MANYTLLDYSLNTSFNVGSDIMPLESISDGIDLTQSMCNTLKVTYPFKVYNSASYVGTSEGYSGTVFMSVFIFDSEPTIEATFSGTLEHIGNYYIFVRGASTTAPTYTDYVTSLLELFLVQDTFKTYIGTHIVTGGGAGSGYIGNSLVSNKKMVGYNVPTSSAEATKTESVSVYSATKEANKPKAGNGFARVKFVRDIIEDEDSWYTVETRVGTWIDGKPIYQILFVGVNKTLTRNWDNLVDVSPLNIDEVLYIDLLGVSNSDYYGSLVAIQGAQVGLLNDYIVGYAVNTNITPYVTKAKIRYTKTTDT